MRTILLLACVLTVTAACRKENTINRKLDGNWNAAILFGEAPSSNESFELTFNSEAKAEGMGVLVIREDSRVDSYGFTYFLKRDRMTMIIDQDAYVFTMNEYSNRRITMTDTYGDVTLLENRWFD